MGMQDPKPTFTYLVGQLVNRHPEFSYLHVIEPRVDATTLREVVPVGWTNDIFRDIWVSPQSNRRFISAGGYTRDLAVEFADKKDDIIVFGRPFISNVCILLLCFRIRTHMFIFAWQPDLPHRLLHDIPLTAYDRTRFYGPSTTDPKGFTDYPFAKESVAPQSRF